MDVVWDRPGDYVAVRDVLELLGSGHAYTTVLTVMQRLYHKGLLRRRRDGRAWSYRPALSRDAWAAASMTDALHTAKDRRGALLHFVADLGAEEADALRRVLGQDGRG